MTQTTEEFADRLFRSALGTAELLSVYLGDRLGWYRALADGGPADAAALVERAGGIQRYAREWLEQQASVGILTTTGDGRFALPPGAAEVLTDTRSLNYLAPLARTFAAAAIQLPALVGAYRDGGGVGWATYGTEMREAQADANRPWFEHALPAALAGVPELDDVLRRPGARIADIGCGGGWSSIALARAYPQARVDGFDVDQPSVALATANAREVKLRDRVTFHHVDASGLPGSGDYDAAFAFECMHDLPRPVEVLTAIRGAVRPGAPVVVMDEAVGETFHAPGDDVERLMYGFSTLVCLPDSLTDPESVGTGTVMRPETLRGYAQAAGFSDVDVLPISDFGFFRFYSLRH
ncbi:SAM-dependent methyltransferase [Asanoa ishikariensis]|uniref:Methyltransferase domain-containing protein n=1 Tax=Asanoa ishikariensis TaxID=137265 RepID=A0A1H3NH50_9ACTN|nr:class I SAM-dependent methyltransferase [Asanoa ishikariensis]GIF68620.1 SAM-dependent methyltransferase [Asanoa ishikariensis]SDY88212.1 Methyltransferase domain-containing protein [Asanoa ishikariensis]